jgi:hypothetical protein
MERRQGVRGFIHQLQLRNTMTNAIKFNLISYNTHLFFSLPGVDFGPLFADGARKLAINQQYLELQCPASKGGIIQLAALQEVWYSSFANDITEDVAKHGSYKNEFVNYRGTLPPAINPSGLILLADPDPACSFHHQKYFDYITHFAVGDGDGWGWDSQDLPTMKGYLKVKCDFPVPNGPKVSLGLFTTHMPTNYGKHPKSVTACFQALANEVSDYRSKYPASAVIVLGDLNVASGSDKYQTLVADILLSGDTGLKDAANLMDPGWTINPQTNTLWQHFNPNQENDPPTRIDYLLFADSADGGSKPIASQQIQLNSFAAKTDGLTFVEDKTGLVYNCSDHYPIEAGITINVTS